MGTELLEAGLETSIFKVNTDRFYNAKPLIF